MYEETPDSGMTRIMNELDDFFNKPKHSVLYRNDEEVTDIEMLDWQLFTNYAKYKQ
jgi:hypothetical protein